MPLLNGSGFFKHLKYSRQRETKLLPKVYLWKILVAHYLVDKGNYMET